MALLGIDHVCLSTADPEKIENEFFRLHYSRVFVEKGIPVPPEKRDYLRHPSVAHDLVYLKSGNDPAIEILNHHMKTEFRGDVYSLVFGANRKNDRMVSGTESPVSKAIHELLQKPCQRIQPEFARFSWFYSEKRFRRDCGLIVTQVRSLDHSLPFWEKGLGFSAEMDSPKAGEWALLKFVAAVPSWGVFLLLVQNPEADYTAGFLDDEGVTCLSFFASDMEASLQKLKQFGGGDIGKKFRVVVQSRSLEICFARSPDGQLVELIRPDFPRAPSKEKVIATSRLR